MATKKTLPKKNPEDTKEQTRYRVFYRDAAGRQTSKTFNRSKAADDFKRKVEQGNYVAPSAGSKKTVKAFGEEWQGRQPKWSDSTREKVRSLLNVHIYPTFGNRPLGSIQASEVEQWLADMVEEDVAANSIRSRHEYFSALMQAAVRDEGIPSNPCARLDLPSAPATNKMILETEQVRAWAAAMAPRYRVAMSLGAGLGLRAGEMLGLTVDRIDFRRNRVRIDRQAVRVSGTYKLAKLKDGSRRRKTDPVRILPLPAGVKEDIQHHLDTYGPGDQGVLVGNEAGRLLRQDMFGRYLGTAINSANAEGAHLPEEATFHYLRHYYASLLIERGHSVKVVQKRLGHASAVLTLDTYGHLWPDDEDRTILAVDEMLGSLMGPSPGPRAADPGIGLVHICSIGCVW